MPDRFQVVFGDGVVEALLLDGHVRRLSFDPAGSPFSAGALEEPEVKAALRKWMTDTNAEGWIGWQELAEALKGLGIDMAAVASRNPG